MPVVINEFEVVPDAPRAERGTSDGKSNERSSETREMSDYEVKQMLERRAERLERVSAH